MINPFKEVNWRPDAAALRSFGKSWVIGFPTIAVALFFADRIRTGEWHATFPFFLGGIGAAAGLLFWLLPAAGKPFHVVWYALASCIGLVIGNVVLSLVFWVFVAGLGMLKRMFGKPAIRQGPDLTATTYWIDAPPPPKPTRYYSQF